MYGIIIRSDPRAALFENFEIRLRTREHRAQTTTRTALGTVAILCRCASQSLTACYSGCMKILSVRGILSVPFALAALRRTSSSRGVVKMSSGHQLVLDAFGARQFNNPNYVGTQISYDVVEFERFVNQAYTDGAKLVDGYAPFW